MKRNYRHALAVALTAFAGAHVQATPFAQPFQNGSFELGTTGNETTTKPVYWLGTVQYFPIVSYPTLAPAADGLKLVDLATGNPGVGNLSQTFLTVPGQLYTVGFSIGNSNLGGLGGASSIDVAPIGNYPGGNFGIAPTTSIPIDWSNLSFSFIASGTTSTLKFSTSADPSLAYAFLDGVNVTTVPEPSTWTMALAGAGVLGFMAWRRKVI